MNILRRLIIRDPSSTKTIIVGEATTESELHDVFKLRYDVYFKRGYIDAAKYPEGLEIDNYDTKIKSRYFVAILQENHTQKMIGCIRMILDDPLPTEVDFNFKEPKEMESIARNSRFELGRFIIIPPDLSRRNFLPRGLVMLLLFDVIGEYGKNHKLEGGYAFIKLSLSKKMKRIGFPVGYIKKFRQIYPENGVLYKYFTQRNDPVIPIFFITKSFLVFTQKILKRKYMFDIENDNYVLKNNLYTHILKLLKIV